MIINDLQLCPHEACNFCYRDDDSIRRCNKPLVSFLKCIGEHHGINAILGDDENVMIVGGKQ